MDIRALRYFSIIAAEGSFSRAADVLRIAQPALSLQVKKLETDLGVELLHRTSKGIVLTVAGEKLLTHARDILRRFQLAEEDLRNEAVEPIGRVAIGMSQSTAMLLTLPLVEQVTRHWPRVALHVLETSTGHIPGWLRSGTLDFGIVFKSDNGQGLLFDHLVDEDLLLIGTPQMFQSLKTGNRSRDRREITLPQLSQLPLILPAKLHGLRELIDGHARKSGVELNVVAEVDAMPQLRDVAVSGLGCTILSYASVRPELQAGTLRGMRIVSPSIGRSVYLCRPSDAPPTRATQVIYSFIRETVVSLVSDGSWPARLPGRG